MRSTREVVFVFEILKVGGLMWTCCKLWCTADTVLTIDPSHSHSNLQLVDILTDPYSYFRIQGTEIFREKEFICTGGMIRNS
jgi:hypothetical protein